MNTCSMVRDCMRHQNPDLFASVPPVAEPSVPNELRYGRYEINWATGPAVPEEDMGSPDAVPLGSEIP